MSTSIGSTMEGRRSQSENSETIMDTSDSMGPKDNRPQHERRLTKHDCDVLASTITNELAGTPDIGSVFLHKARTSPKWREQIELYIASIIYNYGKEKK